MFAVESLRRHCVKNWSLSLFIFVCLYVRVENRPRIFFFKCAFYCKCMRQSRPGIHEIASAVRPTPGVDISFPTDDLVMGVEPEADEQIRPTVYNNLT